MISKNCILCGKGSNTEIYFKHQNFEIIHCKNCGLYYQHTPVQFESLNNLYNNIYRENPQDFQNTSYLNKRIKIYLRDINMYQKKGNLLDIGCSYGLLMKYFIKNGWKATGIDINENAIRYAKSKGLNCYNTTLENFEPKNKFDLVVMSHVLEHLEKPIDSLRIIKNWLSNNGIIYIRVPNVESVILISRRQSFIGNLKPFEHLFYFSKGTLRLLLEKAGLKSTIKIDGRINVGEILNCYLRARFILSAHWQNINYKTKTKDKKKYLLVKRIYENLISVLEYFPFGQKNSEIVAIAGLGDVSLEYKTKSNNE